MTTNNNTITPNQNNNNNNNNNYSNNSGLSSREALMATPPIHLPVNPLNEYAK